MTNRALLFSLVAAATPAMAMSAAALAAGQHAGGHGQPMQHGQPGDPAKVDRVIDMTMNDTMRFTPDRITVKAGETVRFVLKNVGKVPHEFVIGPMDELREHAEMMRRMPGMKHDEPNSITLEPRQIGGVVWQFDRPGTVDFACLIPGHFEAGMVGKVRVEVIHPAGTRSERRR